MKRLDLQELSLGDQPIAIPDELPILPLRDTVLFPNSFMPLAVARESSVRLIDEAISAGKLIGVFTQRDASVEEPQQADLYAVGTASHIHKMFKLPDGSLRLIVQGLARLTLDEVTETPAVPARRASRRPSKPSTTRITSRSTRCCGTSRRTSSRSSRCRRCSPTISRRWRRTSPSRGAWPTSSPRA